MPGPPWPLLSHLGSLIGYVAEILFLCRRPGKDDSTPTSPDTLPTDPFADASILSSTFFMWASGLIAVGLRRPLHLSDLWDVRPSEKCANASSVLRGLWEAELAQEGPDGAKFSRVVMRSVRVQMAWVCAWKMGWLLFGLISNCYLLRALILWFRAGPSASQGEGLLLALGFFLAETARSICVNRHWLLAVLVGVQLRAGARGLLYEKSLSIRGGGSHTGKLVQLVTGDCSRLLEGCNYSEFLISAPVTTLAALALMLWLIGPAALAGFGVLLLYIPLQSYIGTLVSATRRETALIADERTGVMSEILTGIKLLKLYSYEGSFAAKVDGIRGREVARLRYASILRAINTSAALSVTVLVLLATFATFTLASPGAVLTVDAAFTVLALFNVARFPLGILPQATRCFTEARVACARIEAFLKLPEARQEDLPCNLATFAEEVEKVAPTNGAATSGGVALAAKCASFSWSSPSNASSSRKPEDGVAACGGVVLEVPDAGPPSSSSSSGRAEEPLPLHLVLTSLSFSIPKGTLTAIIGPVGSGKSSLLEAFLGQLTLVSGVFGTDGGSISYAPQSPWIFSGTLRENILFGAPFHEARYASTLFSCALLEDLKGMPAGDETEIGERGINLSGGQKARVGLARALYAEDKDTFLLDDVLSALDAHVGMHVWREGICRLQRTGKTVLFVTHAHHLLGDCDATLTLKEGRVESYYTTRRAAIPPDSAEVGQGGSDALSPPSSSATATATATAAAADTATIAASTAAVAAETFFVSSSFAASNAAAFTTTTTTTSSSSATTTTFPAAAVAAVTATIFPPSETSVPAASSSSSKLVASEERNLGKVESATWGFYFIAAGGLYIAFIAFILLLVGKGSVLVSSYILSFWTTRSSSSAAVGGAAAGDSAVVLNLYLPLYAGSVALVLVFNVLQGLLFAQVTTAASLTLHNRVFASVIRGTMQFFESQPVGRILSRFTGDVDTLDAVLPAGLESCAEFLMQCALTVLLIAVVFPAFLGLLVVMLGIFYFLTSAFRRVATELKRVDNLSRGPLVSHVTATASGLTTISAFCAAPRFLAANHAHTDTQSRTYWGLYAANRWLAIRVDVLTSLTAAIVAAFCVVFRGASGASGGLTPGSAALALAYSLSLAGTLQFSVRLTTELENSFTCVERLAAYTNEAIVPHEKAFAAGAVPLSLEEASAVAKAAAAAVAAVSAGAAVQAPAATAAAVSAAALLPWNPSSWLAPLCNANWPWSGEIVFKSFSTAYRADLPLVLDGLSFTVPPGSTCGLVGRTGSGKTSLMLSIFRLLEASRGGIFIDGVDIARVNLYHLRSRMAIIPQDPTLFTGTLRSNVDPFSAQGGAAGAANLRGCLEKAGLRGYVAAQALGLDAPVLEGGANLSSGQRQLVCMARALLRGAKILVLDEATASLDEESDRAVQHALATSFGGCTILIVAHRLRTVIQSDQIVALSGGQVVECASPAALLRNEGGIFSRLVSELGLAEAAELHGLAAAAEKGKKILAATPRTMQY